METWSHDGKLYEVTSGYSHPDDAWQYELVGLTGPPGAGPYLSVSIPDATPDGPFTPRPTGHVVVHADGGTVPWVVLEKLLRLLDSSGDLVDEHRDLSPTATALPLTLTIWSHHDQRFQVSHFHDGDADSWIYELYEVDPANTGNNYIDARVPDERSESGPFVPMSAEHVTLTMHGRSTFPWPVFRRFLDAIRAAGDIVGSTGEPGQRRQPSR
ncbi:hypothetical protein ABZS77_22560 [Micromonospora sp. NPDC005298]|uniref:hypothetical protein n=1 Tax=Micromonospora sp. NPDC005298 TaxID=3156873 RepID=UPI0033A576E0